jgi:hypothetical protein
MRRWLMFLLLVAMPFQIVWAGAAQYCSHETEAAVKKHVGHHEHRHEVSPDAGLSVDVDAATDAAATYDPDCGTCHLGASVSLTASALVVIAMPTASRRGVPPQRFLSHVPGGPERPDRADLAAAVRFGGGVGVTPSRT